MQDHPEDRFLLVAQSNAVLRFLAERLDGVGVCTGSGRTRSCVVRKFRQPTNQKVRHLALTLDTLRHMSVENIDRVCLLHDHMPLFVVSDHVTPPPNADQLFVHTIRHVA